MRIELSAARTWLIGAVALWALLFWVLSLAGMGGRIARLADDPGLLQPLPAPPAQADERLGPLPQYAAIGDRPLFTEDRRPQPFFINPENPDERKAFDFVLTSVLLAPGFEMAILRPADGSGPQRVKVGQAIESLPTWTLISVSSREAVFSGPEGTQSLELRVFDGTGGEAPTVVAVPMPTPVAPAAPTSSSPRASTAVPTASPATPAPATQPAAVADAGPGGVQELTPEAQVEAIRQRIEARRAELRRAAEQQPAPAPPTPRQLATPEPEQTL